MEKRCDFYTSEDVSRLIDREISSEKCRSFEHHLSHCRDCRELADRYRLVSFAFSRYTDRMTKGIENVNMEQQFEKTLFVSKKKPLKHFSGLFGKNVYLKLASVIAVIMIGLFPFDDDLLKDPLAGPSAIVNSVDTEYTSVMIIETQEEKHTIIWFSEET